MTFLKDILQIISKIYSFAKNEYN